MSIANLIFILACMHIAHICHLIKHPQCQKIKANDRHAEKVTSALLIQSGGFITWSDTCTCPLPCSVQGWIAFRKIMRCSKNFYLLFVKLGLRSCLHCIIQTLLWSHLFRLLCGAHDYISQTAMPLLLELPIKYGCNIILILHWVAKAPILRTTDVGSPLSGMTQTRALCLLHPAQITVPKGCSLHTSPSAPAAFPFGELLPPNIKIRS